MANEFLKHLILTKAKEPYTLAFDKVTNVLNKSNQVLDGISNAKTTEEHDVSFKFTNAIYQKDLWQTLKSSGSISNLSPITGMKQITVYFKGELDLFYGYTNKAFSSKTIHLVSGVPFDFDNNNPKYFKLLNPSDTNSADIVSMVVSYSCNSNDKMGNEEYTYHTSGDYTYVNTAGGVGITKYNGTKTDEIIEIPSSINGQRVTKIFSGAFKETQAPLPSARLKAKEDTTNTYFIPDSIVTIEDGTFPYNSIFTTDNGELPEGWVYTSFTYTENGEDNNVILGLQYENLYLINDTLYEYDYSRNALFGLKCMTIQENYVLPDTINLPKLGEIRVEEIKSGFLIGNEYIKSFTGGKYLVWFSGSITYCPNLITINLKPCHELNRFRIGNLPALETLETNRNIAFVNFFGAKLPKLKKSKDSASF